MVFAGLGSSLNGSLEFFAVNSKHSMTTQEHFQCSDLQWDPSGRYLATFVKQPLHPDANSWRFASNNGYRIWNVIGELLFEQSLSSLYQFLWRPRPQTLLSPEKTKEISKSLRDKYYRQFDEQDTAARESQLSGEAKKKAEAKAAFKALREAQMEEYRKQEDARKALRGSKESIWEEIDIQVEEEISTTVDILEE
jgi:translation initiation factor 3 subunit B